MPGAMMKLGASGVKIGTGLNFARRSGGMSVGKIGDTGLIGVPAAVCGIGCVDHGFSPSSEVSVGTGISLIGWTGSPVSRFWVYRYSFFLCLGGALFCR